MICVLSALLLALSSSIAMSNDLPPKPDFLVTTNYLTLFQRPGHYRVSDCETGPIVCAGFPKPGSRFRVHEQLSEGGRLYYRVSYLNEVGNVKVADGNRTYFWIDAEPQSESDRKTPFLRLMGRRDPNGKLLPLPPNSSLAVDLMNDRKDGPVRPTSITAENLAALAANSPSVRLDCPTATQLSSQGNTLVTMMNQVLADDGVYKSSAEIDHYLSCYSKPKGKTDKTFFEDYQSVYKEKIEAASESFGVPDHLMKCLGQQESQWDKSVQSPTGARSVMQLMRNTISRPINSILSEYLPLSGQELANIWKRNLQEQSQSHLAGKSPDKNKNYNWTASKIRYQQMAELWKEHFRKIDLPIPSSVSYDNDITGTKNVDTTIAASAFYLRYIFDELHERLNKEGVQAPSVGSNQDQRKKLLMIVAGAYNAGAGAGSDIIGSVKPPSVDGWFNALSKRSHETGTYMENIGRCLSAGVTEGPRRGSAKLSETERPRCPAN